MRFTEAPKICTPFIFASCDCSLIARETTGKSSAKDAESTVFRKVVLAILFRVSRALSMLALSIMLLTISAVMFLISGVPANSVPKDVRKFSASFFTSFRASPTASRTADITLGIQSPSCLGQPLGAAILFNTPITRPMTETFTFHLPAAAAPMCANNTGNTISGTALPLELACESTWHRSSALPSGSPLTFASSRRRRTAGKAGR
mmetsp:Transcript_74097/g.131014  ORF Transcript_74097/g.131014 Transcript_74097/m.131014 type:complete len:206 (+) Transcript_74097:3177-3794(+)